MPSSNNSNCNIAKEAPILNLELLGVHTIMNFIEIFALKEYKSIGLRLKNYLEISSSNQTPSFVLWKMKSNMNYTIRLLKDQMDR